MNKAEFVAKIASRMDVKSKDAEGVIDSTISELFAPRIFGTEGLGSVFHSNDCNNNCKEEMARVAPTRG
jgi:hypothetical protein